MIFLLFQAVFYAKTTKTLLLWRAIKAVKNKIEILMPLLGFTISPFSAKRTKANGIGFSAKIDEAPPRQAKLA